MKEFVGECSECGAAVYCKDGFLDGVHEDGMLFCSACSEGRDS
ncbi:hypothetical protein [Gracilibacillus sp. YIM 98692]|nr:hypothetical protein [Gracilibacillus sp. YIM 98692]